MFFALSFLFLFYKAYIFSYVSGYFVLEILAICALLGLQIMRIYIGSKGNKTESSIIMVLFLLCTAASCAVKPSSVRIAFCAAVPYPTASPGLMGLFGSSFSFS